MASARGGLGFGDFDGRPDRYADFAGPQDIASIQFESAHQRTFIDKFGVGHRVEPGWGGLIRFGAGDAKANRELDGAEPLAVASGLLQSFRPNGYSYPLATASGSVPP